MLSPIAILSCNLHCLSVTGSQWSPNAKTVGNEQTPLLWKNLKLIVFSKHWKCAWKLLTSVVQSYHKLYLTSRAVYALNIELYFKNTLKTQDIWYGFTSQLQTTCHGLGDCGPWVSCSVALSKRKPSMKENELRNLSEGIGHLRHLSSYMFTFQ